MAKKNKISKKQKIPSPIQPDKNPSFFITLLLGLIIIVVSDSFHVMSQSPAVDIKWFMLKIGAVILTMIWLLTFVFSKTWKWKIHPIHLPLLIYLIITLISHLLPSNRWYLFEPFTQLVCLMMIYVIVSQATDSLKNISLLLHCILLGAAVVSIYAVIQQLGLDPIKWEIGGNRKFISSMLGNSNLLGWFLAPMLPLSIVFLLSDQNRMPLKILKILYIFLILTALGVSQNRAGILASVIGCLIIFWLFVKYPEQDTQNSSIPGITPFLKYIQKYKRILQFIILFIVILGLLGFWHKYSKQSDIAIKGRFLHWQISSLMIKDHPLFGLGPGNYFLQYLEYQGKVLNDPRNTGYSRTATEVQSINAAYAHNEYIQSMTDTGILGFAAFSFFLLTYIIIGYRDLKFIQNKETRWLYQGCYAAVMTILITSFFGFPLHMPATAMQFWIFLGMTVSLSHLEKTPYAIHHFWWRRKDSSKPVIPLQNPALLFTLLGIFVIFGIWIIKDSLDSFRVSFYIREGRYWAENEKDFPEAIKFMEKAVALSPENGLAHYYLGGYYANMKRYQDAILEYNKSMKSYNDILLYYNFGQIYFSMQDYENAEKYYNKTLQLKKSFYQCHKQLGLIQVYHYNNIHKGIEEFNKYLEINPMGDEAENVRTLIQQLEKLPDKPDSMENK